MGMAKLIRCRTRPRCRRRSRAPQLLLVLQGPRPGTPPHRPPVPRGQDHRRTRKQGRARRRTLRPLGGLRLPRRTRAQALRRDQHQYLFEQVQSVTESISKGKTSYRPNLQFNHPCKELIWTFHDATTGKQLSLADCKLDRAKIRLNGHDLFADRDAKYFSQVQRYTHHTNGGSGDDDSDIFLYSFALFPEKLQPSGTCNMSRIDNSTLELTFTEALTTAMEVRVTAVNYHVLRLTSGMGGVAYSN